MPQPLAPGRAGSEPQVPQRPTTEQVATMYERDQAAALSDRFPDSRNARGATNTQSLYVTPEQMQAGRRSALGLEGIDIGRERRNGPTVRAGPAFERFSHSPYSRSQSSHPWVGGPAPVNYDQTHGTYHQSSRSKNLSAQPILTPSDRIILHDDDDHDDNQIIKKYDSIPAQPHGIPLQRSSSRNPSVYTSQSPRGYLSPASHKSANDIVAEVAARHPLPISRATTVPGTRAASIEVSTRNHVTSR